MKRNFIATKLMLHAHITICEKVAAIIYLAFVIIIRVRLGCVCDTRCNRLRSHHKHCIYQMYLCLKHSFNHTNSDRQRASLERFQVEIKHSQRSGFVSSRIVKQTENYQWCEIMFEICSINDLYQFSKMLSNHQRVQPMATKTLFRNEFPYPLHRHICHLCRDVSKEVPAKICRWISSKYTISVCLQRHLLNLISFTCEYEKFPIMPLNHKAKSSNRCHLDAMGYTVANTKPGAR